MQVFTPLVTLKVRRSVAGFGLYSQESIAKGVTVIEYVGERIPATSERQNRYIFNINTKWDIDGSVRWNTARYINHSCRPNCEAVNRRGRIFIVTRRAIKAGEELTYHYGKDYFDGYIKPAGCRCVKCTGK